MWWWLASAKHRTREECHQPRPERQFGAGFVFWGCEYPRFDRRRTRVCSRRMSEEGGRDSPPFGASRASKALLRSSPLSFRASKASRSLVPFVFPVLWSKQSILYKAALRAIPQKNSGGCLHRGAVAPKDKTEVPKRKEQADKGSSVPKGGWWIFRRTGWNSTGDPQGRCLEPKHRQKKRPLGKAAAERDACLFNGGRSSCGGTTECRRHPEANRRQSDSTAPQGWNRRFEA